MNLKEAFRFQNKITSHLEAAQRVLQRDSNITKVQVTYFRHKVDPSAEDEVMAGDVTTDYADHITEMAECMLYLLEQKVELARAIRKAKNALDYDIDAEVSINTARQTVSPILMHMVELRNSEQTFAGGGYGYRLNNDGNQVSYKCDSKKVTTINYDRNIIRKMLVELNKQADATSAEIDRHIINTSVEYEQPFDVNDSFDDVFEMFLANHK